MNRPLVLLSALMLTTVGIGSVLMSTASESSSDPALMAPEPSTAMDPPPPGEPATPEELRAIAALFDDQPFAGGQNQPRVAKAMTEGTFVFLQFDTSNGQMAKELRYLGFAVQGRFCAESRPDAEMGSFSHFHRWFSPAYGAGHGTVPAAEGYWMSWLAVNPKAPGVGYGLFATPPGSCAGTTPHLPAVQTALEPTDPGEAKAIEALFDDDPFVGGQTSPYAMKWVDERIFVFLEPAEAGPWPNVGVGVAGVYCTDSQPTPDFTQFRRYNATSWDESAGGEAGDAGYWMARYGTGAGSDALGIDRAFAPTPPPECA
ncbi:MAG: hypothetical protein KY455_01655 [Euryarchaeota archaeon]|nr:hypothetical protein [Euryarchaeota archaeon]